eukprot:SAG31_NODE_636_length_13344_cov_8.492451_4_plen_88_part_00
MTDDEPEVAEVPIPKDEEQLDRIEHAIAHNFLFQNLDKNVRDEVIGLMFERRCKAGEVIIKQVLTRCSFVSASLSTCDTIVAMAKVT